MSPAAPPRRSHLVPMAGDASLGVSMLAGVLLLLMGFFHILLAFVALVGNNEDVMVHSHYAYEMNVTTWGWIHLVTGVAAVVIGIGLFLGWRWAYVLGLVVAFMSALDNFAFLPHAPIWSAVMLAFDVLVIWALVQELREPD
jgi:hypothetical protein